MAAGWRGAAAPDRPTPDQPAPNSQVASGPDGRCRLGAWPVVAPPGGRWGPNWRVRSTGRGISGRVGGATLAGSIRDRHPRLVAPGAAACVLARRVSRALTTNRKGPATGRTAARGSGNAIQAADGRSVVRQSLWECVPERDSLLQFHRDATGEVELLATDQSSQSVAAESGRESVRRAPPVHENTRFDGAFTRWHAEAL